MIFDQSNHANDESERGNMENMKYQQQNQRGSTQAPDNQYQMNTPQRDELREKIEKAVWIVEREDIHDKIINSVERLINAQVIQVLDRLKEQRWSVPVAVDESADFVLLSAIESIRKEYENE